MARKENLLMSLLSVWGIMLVVLGHSGFEEPIIMNKLYYLHKWIYSFHMPLFFMISGYLFSYTNENFTGIDAKEFLKKKFLRLLVPYFVLGIVIFLIKYAFSSLSHATREFSISNFFMMFIAPTGQNSTMGFLWYVFTLFVIFSVVIILGKLKLDLKRVGVCFALIVLFWAMFILMPSTSLFNWSTVCKDLPYFIIGILYKRYEPGLSRFFNQQGLLKLAVFTTLSLAFACIKLPISGWITSILSSICGLLMSISLCSCLLKSSFTNNYIIPLSKYTYSIYLLSWFGQYAAKVIFVNILNCNWLVVVIAMFIAGIILPLVVCFTVEMVECLSRQRWLRLVIGL